ncbi:MAG: hypothetical protein KKD44_19695 [Proteobacteria bacterium]|nr:hypothetical protein [Pseudomonadota bacterium]
MVNRMGTPKPFTHRSGIAIIEEAVFLLRNAPFKLLVFYFAGTLPFVMGLLFFWGDMSQSAFAGDYLAPASLGLALLFIWMKCLQSVFTRNLFFHLGGIRSQENTVLSVFRLTAFQALMHASSILIIPLAFLMMLPYAWVYAFYQNCLIADCSSGMPLGRVISDTFKTASDQPGQNHMVMLILLLFKLIVMLNLGFFVFSLPQMAKSLFGIESVFTLGGFNPMNSTFLVSVVCLTHLCVDPLVKTVYTLRFFYGSSEKNGDDLTAELKKIASTALLPLVFFCFTAHLFLGPCTALAQPTESQDLVKPMGSETVINPEKLEKSIHEVLSRRDFAWRMPREKNPEETEPGMIQAFFNWIGPPIKAFFSRIASWIEAFFNWLEKFLPKPDKTSDTQENTQSPMIRYLLYGLLGLTLVLLVGVALKNLMSRRRAPHKDHGETSLFVDVSDENVGADQLPWDSWNQLANSLLEKGEFRLAMRALYLGTLARLSDHGLITVAHYKSNRDYHDELYRRAHDKQDMINRFTVSVSQFEKIWYGMHPLVKEDVMHFAENQERIVGHGQ